MSETTEQIAYMGWKNMLLPHVPAFHLIFHPANGEKREKRTAGRLQAMGVVPGVPDIICLYPRDGFAALAIELKAERRNTPTATQHAWLTQAAEHGIAAGWCRGWEAAAQITALYTMGDLRRLRSDWSSPFRCVRKTWPTAMLYDWPQVFGAENDATRQAQPLAARLPQFHVFEQE